ncbi:MAG TPA: hypothetical protein VN281_14850 [Verrucomicrobiae bacterium]|jgi:hypothetical protein|nr:hypothetical protein [Verrucomicrobiae bacterium]
MVHYDKCRCGRRKRIQALRCTACRNTGLKLETLSPLHLEWWRKTLGIKPKDLEGIEL